ncbi:MAG TPA: hypothetical protein VGF59_05585 [Bryobacteraceae bacterium]|jgi:hypothetical protein
MLLMVIVARRRRLKSAAALLRADRRPAGRHVHHAAARAVFYAICLLDLKIVKWKTV